MKVSGQILSVDRDVLTVRLTKDVQGWCQEHSAREVEIRLDDAREISAEQRRKIYATMRDIAEWSGDIPEAVKCYFKWSFCGDSDHDMFSLSDVDRETARDFLSYLIDFCIQNGVPCSDPLWERCEDISRYMYRCVMTRTCCITGRPDAHIHHVDRVGMRSRDNICHIGMRVVPLSAELHQKVHTESGEMEFYEKHHIVPIALTERMVKHLHMGKVEVS